LLITLNPATKITNPVISLMGYEDRRYFLLELNTKDDIEILINMDQTDWRGYRIRVNNTFIISVDSKTKKVL